MKPYSIASVFVALLSLAAASPSLSRGAGKPCKSNTSLAEKWLNETCKPADLQSIQTTFTPGMDVPETHSRCSSYAIRTA